MLKKIQKSSKIKNIINNNSNLTNYIEEKIEKLQNIIRNTIISIKSNKNDDIFSNDDTILSISILEELYEKTKDIYIQNNKNENARALDQIQKINDKLSMIMCGFGTKTIDDLLYISFGFDYQNTVLENKLINSKFQLIKNHINPVGCKIINWKSNKSLNNHIDCICINKITEDMINIEESNNFECFDIDKSCKSFYQKIFGIRIVIHNEYYKKTLIINGLVDDIQLNCFTNDYIDYRINKIKELANDYSEKIEKDIVLTILESFTLKDILVVGDDDIHKKMIGIITEVNIIKQNKLDTTIKKILDLEAHLQRSVLISLLTYKNDDEIQYLCYILNDLLLLNTSEENSNLHFIYDSIPSNLKKNLKNAIKYTVKYTNEMLQKYDIHKITLEQQIYLMKANDVVKEKAIIKLKEIKSRSDETGLKAKQYLEGLLKIPFNIYREEPILKKTKEINKVFSRLVNSIEQLFPEDESIKEMEKKDKYSIIEMIKFIKNKEEFINNNVLQIIMKTIFIQTNKQVLNIIHHINTVKKSKKEKKIQITNKTKKEYINDIMSYISQNKNNKLVVSDIFDIVHTDIPISLNKPYNDILQIKSSISQIDTSMSAIEEILDESIYSHKHAKNQIMKIIAQWMNGEQTGYCFGFEGCPGIGKTSLAKKGLANCLKDDNGESRPFAFIALGGSSNGSMLEGHSYTYMNSSWGRIVDILMETKCMNPIIYIDELDKVSKTENGKEIIGIFTHLIDSTQNDRFQDKYFSGIDIDLSKALFIFSYNDPEQIDRVLLDRIHRIKFDNLTLNDKLIIVRKYIIPEINKKMGFDNNIIEISDEIIEFIIINYTMEPGVRKLKEIFFDLYGEINLLMLKTNFDSEDIDIPIVITRENIENKYLLKYDKIKEKGIHSTPRVGIINGLWANQLSGGGIIPIQTTYYPSSTFLELKLTGLQGDVMKESMNVAKSLAWNLTEHYIKKNLIIDFEETKQQGLHIHCPDGSISKDGPSAGAAITVAIYSLLNKLPINNTIAITGEICLTGEIRAIGGLENKINGGIRSGITTFLFPKENETDYNKWMEKDDNKSKYNKIKFIKVSNIDEVLKYIFKQ